MTALFKKLNFKNQKHILAIDYPDSFQSELNEMQDEVKILSELSDLSEIEFTIVFVTEQESINRYISQIVPKLGEDALLWFCYPKKSSKRYTCDFNRDSGWEIMGDYNLEPVRMVAIDEDWSALRFRNVDKIKKITRRQSMALTDSAKARTTNKKK